MTKINHRGKCPGGAEIALDAAIYSAEAVKLAAFVFSGRAVIRIRPGKKASHVSVSAAADERLTGEFLNEVLNQQCRMDLSKKNSRIAGIITTKALLSAAGGK
jgi:His-Xaa-Ser system protein HxsD